MNYEAGLPMRFFASLRMTIGTLKELFGALFDDLPATVVAAFRAYAVIHHRCATVGANAQGRYGSEVVGTALVSSLLGEFVFRMCHFFILF